MKRRRIDGIISLFVLVLLAGALSMANAPASLAAAPTISSVTPITGTDKMVRPGAGVANLDAGDLVAGNTKWDPTGTGMIFNDTWVGFLWAPDVGSTVFAQYFGIYLTPNFVISRAIAPDRTVVGGDIIREELRVLPFLWTPQDGFNYLPTTCHNRAPAGNVPTGVCSGGAAAVSADGETSVGVVYDSVTSPSQAARWTAAHTKKGLRLTLDLLAPHDPWSDANDISPDGAVIVGDSGPASDALAAAKWVNGSPAALAAVGDSSSALFTAADGGAAIGWASLAGRMVLVRWDAAGVATSFDAPGGASIMEIKAVNPQATAAVGALAVGDNWAPFLWTQSGGFTVIPELNEPAYDRSEALDVSDDGSVVVGGLQASVVSNGFPRAYGFLWSERTGLVLITDLMTAWGQADADYYQASAISGDGLRILSAGNAPGTDHDTHSVIITLSPF